MKVAIVVAIVFFILAAFFALKYFTDKPVEQAQMVDEDIINENIDRAVESEVEKAVQGISDEDVLNSLLE
ncbi:MAG: hypothetical protein QXF12_05230 [Candidatus Aenigmatarchaeota archaeon]